MIPAVMDPTTTSPGERELYRRLRDDPATSDWVVLHSLLLREHPTRVSGEADFVAIIPSLGVLVIEVKGCRSLKVDEGLWYYGGAADGDPRGPFRQASEAMHAIKGYMTDAAPRFSGIVFWSAVVFPFIAFDIRSQEWHRWQVIDAAAFRRGSIADSLSAVLQHARSKLQSSPGGRWFDPGSPSPTIDEVSILASTLRPRFELVESPKQRRRREEEELLVLTREQYDALDTMEENPRVVFEGPAGTGKTLLALEAARRSALQGRRVLLACFNRALGQWMRDEVGGLPEGSYVGTFSSYMVRVSGSGAAARPHDSNFWHTELPGAVLEAILDRSVADPFDELILDEAQDLLSDPFLDVLDVSLEGGLAAGRWRMFGDFERQALFGQRVSLRSFLDERSADASIHSLRVNCRNTPRIAALTRLLAGLTPDYRRVRRPDDGVEPSLAFVDAGDESTRLIDALERFQSEGFQGSDIVILSASARDPAAARLRDQPWCDCIQPMDTAQPGAIRYCTIHAFKGLEAPAIIVTDLRDVESDESRALLYVALTRALDRLVVLLPKEIAPKVAKRLSQVAVEYSDAG
jgi:hypothetical protein